VAYIQPNGPAQWLDLLVTRQYEGEGLHFINNYLEHFGAPGIGPITPVQFVEAIVLAEVAEFFSQDEAALALLTTAADDLLGSLAATPQFGFDELAWPDVPSAISAVPSQAGSTGATDWALAATLYDAVLSMPTSPDHHPA